VIEYSLVVGVLTVKDSFFLPSILDTVKLSLDMFPDPSTENRGSGGAFMRVNCTVSELFISLGKIHSAV